MFVSRFHFMYTTDTINRHFFSEKPSKLLNFHVESDDFFMQWLLNSLACMWNNTIDNGEKISCAFRLLTQVQLQMTALGDITHLVINLSNFYETDVATLLITYFEVKRDSSEFLKWRQKEIMNSVFFWHYGVSFKYNFRKKCVLLLCTYCIF